MMGKTSIEGLIGAGSVFATHLFQRKEGKGLARFGVMTQGKVRFRVCCSVPEYQGEFDHEARAGSLWPK